MNARLCLAFLLCLGLSFCGGRDGDKPPDTDGDGIEDSDNDDVPDTRDAFPNDACASVDTDGDGMPDTLVTGCTTSLTEDTDDDNDGVDDVNDTCPTASLNPASGNATDPTADPDMDGCKKQ